MIHLLCVVFDSKSKDYRFPVAALSRAEAVRGFSSACSNPESDLHKYAEDFSLYCSGTIDLDTGMVVSYPAPELIITGVQASKDHNLYYASQVKPGKVV